MEQTQGREEDRSLRLRPRADGGADPILSVVVISRDDEAVIERTLRSVVTQDCEEPFEVIVVTSGTDRTAQIVRTHFPQARLVQLDHRALPGEARNAGLDVATGCYVSFPGSHVELLPNSLAARLRAHRGGYEMVTGTMLNGTRTWSGWASYFLDNASMLPGRPSEPLTVAPIRCSYRRDVLEEVGGFPEDMRTGEDTVVNDRLFARGCRAVRAQDVVLRHHSPCRTPARLLRHHFTRGRGLARVMTAEASRMSPLPTRRMTRYALVGVPLRVRAITRQVRTWGDDLRWRFWIASPLVVAGAISSWVGTQCELGRLAARAMSRRFDDTTRR